MKLVATCPKKLLTSALSYDQSVSFEQDALVLEGFVKRRAALSRAIRASVTPTESDLDLSKASVFLQAARSRVRSARLPRIKWTASTYGGGNSLANRMLSGKPTILLKFVGLLTIR